jgi:hypothetical protein
LKLRQAARSLVAILKNYQRTFRQRFWTIFDNLVLLIVDKFSTNPIDFPKVIFVACGQFYS